MKKSRRLIFLMEYNMYIEKTGNFLIRLSRKIYIRINVYILIFAFISNGFILLLDNHNSESFGIPEDHEIFLISRMLMFILCLTRVIVSLVVEGPLILMEAWTEIFSRYKSYLIEQRESGHLSKRQLTEMNFVILTINKDINEMSS